MYFIIRDHKERRTGPYSNDNPEYRRAFGEAREKHEHTHPRTLSPERRLAIKQMRFQGKRPELIAKSAAIRALMEEEINR